MLRNSKFDCLSIVLSSSQKASSSRSTKRYADFGGSEQARSPLTSSRLHLSSDHRQRGAFVPFIRDWQLNSPILSQPTDAVPDAAPELRVTPAVRSAGQNVQISRGFDVDVNVQGREYHSSDARMSTDQSGQTRTSVSQQQRKARRWCLELSYLSFTLFIFHSNLCSKQICQSITRSVEMVS